MMFKRFIMNMFDSLIFKLFLVKYYTLPHKVLYCEIYVYFNSVPSLVLHDITQTFMRSLDLKGKRVSTEYNINISTINHYYYICSQVQNSTRDN